MAPNAEVSSTDLPSSSSSPSPPPSSSSSSVTATKAFDVAEVVSKLHASSPTALADLEQLAEQAILDISSFIATTATFQLSSFGPTGLVTLDLLSRSGLLDRVPVVFIDTLYHFQETYDLVERVKARYPNMRLHVYKPKGCATQADFEAKYGEKLWERVPSKFAYYTKAEPRDRAMEELQVSAYINGRRRSQGSKRGDLSLLDVDRELNITRVQPLYDWSFEQVWAYIKEHDVPYNSLHDKGFKSVGDFMTTAAGGDDDGERSGRWKGSSQTECGLHLSPSQLRLLGIPTSDTSLISVA